MNVGEFLLQVEAFRSLSRESAERLGQRCVIRDYENGDAIIRRGDPGESMFVIASGWVRVPIIDDQGRQQFLAQLGAKQFFGEMALLTGEPRNADVFAASECRCVVIPKDALEDLLAKNPEVASFLTEILGQRLMEVGGIRKVGKYRLIGELGRGGMAVVYEGLHPTLGRSVAIKMLSHALVYHPHFADRFRNEAKIIANLRHPNIVEVYDSEEAYATFFIVMEKLTGRDIERILETRGTMTYQEVRDVIKKVAGALDYAHNRGIVHRDVKPSNIVINEDGTVKLTDFGLAMVPTLEEELNVDRNVSLGTPLYMAPEQATGQKLDGRTDIYALGIVAYEMLTGVPPFIFEDVMDVLRAHVHTPVPSPRKSDPRIPDDLEEFVNRATHKNPKKRFQSCREIVDFFGGEDQGGGLDPKRLRVQTVTFVYDKDAGEDVDAFVSSVRRQSSAIKGLIVK